MIKKLFITLLLLALPITAFCAWRFNPQTGKPDYYESSSANISDTAYGISWSTITTYAPSKKSVYDKIETMSYQWTAAGDTGTPFRVGDSNETVTIKGAGINAVSAGNNVWTITGTETDPKIGTLTTGKWCIESSGKVVCTEDAPAGSGDVTDVGDCADGACLDGTSDGGTYISFYDAQGAGTLIIGDLGAARNWTLPDASGTVAVSASAPATLSAAGDIGVTVSKDLVTTAPLTGGTNDILVGADADITIAIPKADTSTDGYLWSTDWNTFNGKMAGTLLKDIVAGVGLSGGENDVLPGADADTTLTFAPSELEGLTWGGGAAASIVWTYDVSGTDTVMTMGSGLTTFSGDVTSTGDMTITGSDLTLGIAGVKFTGDGDGAVTILSLGDGSKENLILNFDDTANEVDITSGTGVLDIDFNTIDLNTDTLDLTGTGTINGLDSVDATGEDTIEALIFDADAQDISGTWEVQDDVDFVFGNDANWKIQYDEGVDDQLIFITAGTGATATTDPLFEILVGATPTANQEVFGVSKGTQASNTALFTIDEDGDTLNTGNLTVTGGSITLGTSIIFSGGDTLLSRRI